MTEITSDDYSLPPDEKKVRGPVSLTPYGCVGALGGFGLIFLIGRLSARVDPQRAEGSPDVGWMLALVVGCIAAGVFAGLLIGWLRHQQPETPPSE